MSKNAPVIKQIAWIALIPQLLLMGFLIWIFYFFGSNNPVFFGALVYLLLSYGIRAILTKEHKTGMKLSQQGNFIDAINHYENSIDFFTRNSWIDKYRYLTLLSASKMSFKEMGMNNIAFCYSQLGDGKKAMEMYEKTLHEFPNSVTANLL